MAIPLRGVSVFDSRRAFGRLVQVAAVSRSATSFVHYQSRGLCLLGLTSRTVSGLQHTHTGPHQVEWVRDEHQQAFRVQEIRPSQVTTPLPVCPRIMARITEGPTPDRVNQGKTTRLGRRRGKLDLGDDVSKHGSGLHLP